MAAPKYTDEEVARAQQQEEKDQLLETIAMLEKRCVGLRIELNRAKASARTDEPDQKGSGE